MKKVAVIYRSYYGFTKQYAEWIADELDADLFDVKNISVEQLLLYDVVIYGGGIYAGGIAGVKLVVRNPCKNLVVFTVGAADPQATDYTDIIHRNFSAELRESISFFHLQGGLNYPKMSAWHRLLMWMMKTTIANKPEEKRGADDRELLATYGGTVNKLDKGAIQPLVSYVRKQLQ